jgi:hypothetical protein
MVEFTFARVGEYMKSEPEKDRPMPLFLYENEKRDTTLAFLNGKGKEGWEHVGLYGDFFTGDNEPAILMRKVSDSFEFVYKYIAYKDLKLQRDGAKEITEEKQAILYMQKLAGYHDEGWEPVEWRPFGDDMFVLFVKKTEKKIAGARK